MKTFWLSFSGDKGPRGVCILDASDAKAAVVNSHQLGINPGGEVMVMEISADNPDAQKEVQQLGKGRLIGLEELKDLGYKKTSELDDETNAAIAKDLNVLFVCEDHNKGVVR